MISLAILTGSSRMVVIAATAVASFLITALLGFVLIPWLKKLKFGQTIRDIGPSWHKKKQGTPTMGGLLFIIGGTVTLIAVALACELIFDIPVIFGASGISPMAAGTIMALGCAAIGFADDYIKVAKKRNLGLTAPQKMFAQLLVALAYAVTMYSTGATMIEIPWIGTVDFGIWFIPFCIVVIAAVTNAVNFADGVDGLCGMVSFVVALFFLILAGVGGFFAEGLQSAVLAGGMAGFLVWNLHPARVFMGDTGSLFIGGMITAMAFGLRQPFLLLPAGIIYVVEMLSVIIQVLYFKATGGKRLFKMSPIHHHFEMSGWSEMKIVTIFTVTTVIGCTVAWLLTMV